MSSTLIYIVTNDINDKVYIGQTSKTLKERKNGHIASCNAGYDFHFYRAIRKYGIDHFTFTTLHDNIQTQDELNYWEQYYIEKFDSYRSGYNMAPGGYVNVMAVPEVKEKHDAVMRSQEIRDKISQSVIKHHQENDYSEWKKHLSENKKALYSDPVKHAETVAKFRKTFQERGYSNKFAVEGRRKQVIALNKRGEEVIRFDSVRAAAEWWFSHGYDSVKSFDQLSDKIKQSYKQDRYIKGLKWIYLKKGDSR